MGVGGGRLSYVSLNPKNNDFLPLLVVLCFNSFSFLKILSVIAFIGKVQSIIRCLF